MFETEAFIHWLSEHDHYLRRMWTYTQLNGDLSHDDQHVAFGYSGFGDGKNNPDDQQALGIGPIPIGRWVINAPVDTETHGPYVLPLTPGMDTQTFGRSGFLIHGDSIAHPGQASHGCIIVARWVREKIWNSGDRDLLVK